MPVFIDTSAFLAVMNADDEHHDVARNIWTKLLEGENPLVTTNYVLVETIALLQARLGMEAVSTFQRDIMPVIKTLWVDESFHNAGISALVTARRRKLSFVDCISFECMRRYSINPAFTLDPHFREQGFDCMPG